jgi:uncharacterized short protein YbdD (DUF466 family)
MDELRSAWRWAVRAMRMMIGIPDYDTYVEHCRTHHPGQAVMSYEEFFRERQDARFSCANGRFKGCC